MFADGMDPKTLSFWKNRLVDRTLLSALKMYPDHAKEIFGALPVMQGNLLQLGLILGAREVLAAPQGALAFETDNAIEIELRRELEGLADDERAIAQEFLDGRNQEEIARNVARKIIHEATGTEPR